MLLAAVLDYYAADVPAVRMLHPSAEASGRRTFTAGSSSKSRKLDVASGI